MSDIPRLLMNLAYYCGHHRAIIQTDISTLIDKYESYMKTYEDKTLGFIYP